MHSWDLSSLDVEAGRPSVLHSVLLERCAAPSLMAIPMTFNIAAFDLFLPTVKYSYFFHTARIR